MTKLKYALIGAIAGFAGAIGGAQALPAAKVGGAAQVAADADTNIVQIRRGGRHFHGGRHHFRGGMHRHRFHHRHWGGPRLRYRYWGPTIGIYGGYYNRCGWLRQRAAYSGSSYWWRRYNACRYGW